MNRRPNQSRSSYDSFSPDQAAHLRMYTPDADFFKRKKRIPIWRRLLFLLSALLLLLFIVNFAVNQFVFVTRVTVPIRGLHEAFDGFTILHISDLKGVRFGSGQELFGFALSGKTFDVVAMTGDMVSPMGNAQPLYEVLDQLKRVNPAAPIYYIAGDGDPLPVSMEHAAGGSPFAPWVLGAGQRGARLLSSPVSIERDDQRIYFMPRSQLNLDIDTMQGQYEKQYLSALASGDENEIEMTAYQLNSLEGVRSARKEMTNQDIYIALTHTLSDTSDDAAFESSCIPRAVDLMLGGHYLGGLLRLPVIGPLFIPSRHLPHYGLLPGNAYCGLSKQKSTWLYTSAGLGTHDAMYPAWFFRLMNPPTVTLITLTPSAL